MGTFADRFYEHIHSHPNGIIKKQNPISIKKHFLSIKS